MKHLLTAMILILTDIVILAILFYVAVQMRSAISIVALPPLHPLGLTDFIFISTPILALFYFEKLYTLRYDFWQETFKIYKVLFIAYIIIMALMALSKLSVDYSRLFITLYFLLIAIVLPFAKRISKRLLFSFSFLKLYTDIIGDKDQVRMLAKEFEENFYLGMSYRKTNCDAVIIATKNLSLDKINTLINHYLSDMRTVYLVPYVTDINFADSTIMEFTNIRLNTLQVENRLLNFQNRLFKELFDRSFALILLLPFGLIHLLISALIKLDSKGKVFFKQPRLGRHAKTFMCYKYRTMYENSDEMLQNYLNAHPEEKAYYEAYHKYRNDPRITPIGKFLRATSLDELPQIINVLKGEMSLIGPRPYMLEEKKKLGNEDEVILKVKPGITGLWQVSGRNELSFEERKRLEVYYIKNWSLRLDSIILLKTVGVVWKRQGAK